MVILRELILKIFLKSATIFGYVPDDVPFEDFHERTSLQRAYKKFLTDGNMPGQGVGAFIYAVVNKKILK